VVLISGLLVVGEVQHDVLKRQQDPRVDIQCQVQVDRTAAALLWVEVDLPNLSQRVRLDEVSLVVYVEPMVDRVVLEVRDIPGNIDRCHGTQPSGPTDVIFRPDRVGDVDTIVIVDVLEEAASAARAALDELEDWGPNGQASGQYHLDVAADRAACHVLVNAGLSVLSEESGRTEVAGNLWAVLDPIDGSTNAHRGVPFYSTSICVFDGEGPLVGSVVDHCSGRRYHGIRGAGAWRDQELIKTSGSRDLAKSIIGLGGSPRHRIDSWQFRALGCASLELCAVADGTLDAYMLGEGNTLRPWDYLAGLLICVEAGAAVSEADGRDPWVVSDQGFRPVVAASEELLSGLLSSQKPMD
jgi:myo-inositol-1(or 4)-monophosphatase